MIPGAYVYTVNGAAPCGPASATVTVSETGSPDAGADGAALICSNGAAINLFSSLSGTPDPGGTWSGGLAGGLFDPAVNAAGTYTYTLAATPPCASASANVTVTVINAPDAGADNALTVCDQGAATSLFAALGGTPDAGGTWSGPSVVAGGLYDPPTMIPGAYVYTVNGAAPCGPASATVTVSETGSPDAGADGAALICSNGAAINLFSSLSGTPDPGGTWSGGLAGGLFDPAVNAAGTYTYTLAATPPCASASANVTVTVINAPDAGADNALTVCDQGAATSLFAALGGTPDAGGTWSGPSPVTGGLYDPPTMIPGAYVYTVNGAAPCGPASATVTVSETGSPDAGQGNAVALCSSGPPASLFGMLTGSPQQGGSWIGPDGLASTGMVDPATAPSGSYTYVVAGNAPCTAHMATVAISINQAVDAGTDAVLTVCSSTAPIALFPALGGSPDSGGSWSMQPSGQPFNGIFDPAIGTSGTFQYHVAANAPCLADSADVQVSLVPAPQAGADAVAQLCSSDLPINMAALLGGSAQPGGSWTDPSGNAASPTFDPAASLPGVYLYALPPLSVCPGDTALVDMGVAQAADAGVDGDTTVCSNNSPFALHELLGGDPDPGGTWTGPDGAAMNGWFDPANTAAGGYVYTVPAMAPCPQDQALTTVNIIPLPVISPTLSTAGGCAPLEVVFQSGYNGSGNCYWDFGNGMDTTACGPITFTYDHAGDYSVQFTLDLGSGCSVSTILDPSIHVVEQPVAAFQIAGTNGPVVTFNNTSTGAQGYWWDFGGLATSTLVDPQFVFLYGTEQVHTICLTASASPQCMDTACMELLIPASARIFAANAFTPDGDGRNDGFAPVSSGPSPLDYQLIIMDRWGLPVFSTNDPDNRWDGNLETGQPAPPDVYVWKLAGQDAIAKTRFELQGHVTLLR